MTWLLVRVFGMKKFTDVPFTGEIIGKKQGQFKNDKRKGAWFFATSMGI